MLDALVEAKYTKDQRPLLAAANRKLEKLRFLAHLSKDLRLVSVRQYEYFSEKRLEIGQGVGGWLKQERGPG